MGSSGAADRLFGALDHDAGHHTYGLGPRELVLAGPGRPGDLGHGADQGLADDRVVLGEAAVRASESRLRGADGVEALGGTLALDSRTGGETRLLTRIPVDPVS